MCKNIIRMWIIMSDDKMPRINISLTKDQIKQLKDIAASENRKYSQQVLHMMQFYVENKK